MTALLHAAWQKPSDVCLPAVQLGDRLASQCHVASAGLHCKSAERSWEFHKLQCHIQLRQLPGPANHVSKLDKCHLCQLQ